MCKGGEEQVVKVSETKLVCSSNIDEVGKVVVDQVAKKKLDIRMRRWSISSPP